MHASSLPRREQDCRYLHESRLLNQSDPLTPGGLGKNKTGYRPRRGRKTCLEKKTPLSRDDLAGAPGFEPRSTAPKAGVLPLNHAPVRAKLYHSALTGAMLLLFPGHEAQFPGLLVGNDIRIRGRLGLFLSGLVPELIDLFSAGLLHLGVLQQILQLQRGRRLLSLCPA